MRRRDFLRFTAAGSLLAGLRPELLAQTSGRSSSQGAWDSGNVRHLLPTVSDTQMLLKASFATPLAQPPSLRVDSANRAWPHDRYQGRNVGLPRDTPRPRSALHARPEVEHRPGPVSAVGALDVPLTGRSTRAAARSFLHVRGRA